MRAVIQRVTSASVTTSADRAEIGPGLLVLLGVERGDGAADAEYVARKIRELRLFRNGDKEFDRSVAEIGGQVMVVSQFTLAADCRKGRRPSFDAAAPPADARPLYGRRCDRRRRHRRRHGRLPGRHGGRAGE